MHNKPESALLKIAAVGRSSSYEKHPRAGRVFGVTHTYSGTYLVIENVHLKLSRQNRDGGTEKERKRTGIPRNPPSF